MQKRKRRKKNKYDFLNCDLIYSSDILKLNNIVAKQEHHVSESCGDNDNYDELSSAIINNVFEPSYGTFILLFSFTDNYMNSALELIAGANGTGLSVLYKDNILDNKGKLGIHKTYTKDGIKKKFGRKGVHINYLLIGGSPFSYINLYKNMDNMANDLLSRISSFIFIHMNKSLFAELINDMVFNENSFSDWALNPGTIEDCLHCTTAIKMCDGDEDTIDTMISIIDYDNIECIMNQLPDAFNTIDISKFIKIIYEVTNSFGNTIHISSISVYDFLNVMDTPMNDFDKSLCKLINTNKLFYDNLIKGQYIIELMKDEIIAPLYKRNNEVAIFGKIDEADVDEDFMQQFGQRTTFNPVMNDEEDFINIDEVLSEDDPEYNNLQKEKEN